MLGKFLFSLFTPIHSTQLRLVRSHSTIYVMVLASISWLLSCTIVQRRSTSQIHKPTSNLAVHKPNMLEISSFQSILRLVVWLLVSLHSQPALPSLVYQVKVSTVGTPHTGTLFNCGSSHQECRSTGSQLHCSPSSLWVWSTSSSVCLCIQILLTRWTS